MHWSDDLAEKVIARKDEELYTCAAGISPSGIVHFGNFREIVTSSAVVEALRRKGKKARLLFSWDNFDRLRKVPANVPSSFVEHIGKPLSKVPDPLGEFASYAERFQSGFEKSLQAFGYEVEFRYQTEMYESGAYDAQIIHTLKHREEIADIMFSLMTDKAKEEKKIDQVDFRNTYYPIAIYSSFTGKDSTTILSFDGESKVTYQCDETKKTETIDLRETHIAKLAWKLDWPMRWAFEQVSFEPAGHDHASPGSSYDAATILAPKIFNYTPPVYCEYKFVGIQGLGSKMSGSKGNAISPGELLEIYEPRVLRWLYEKKSPDQSFQLAFDSEIYRQYDEFDAETKDASIPFRQAVAYGQIVQWDRTKVEELLKGIGSTFTEESISQRLALAKNWLTKYNAAEEIKLLSTTNTIYELSDESRARIKLLRSKLSPTTVESIPELDELVYSIPKNGQEDTILKRDQRAFFKDVYQLLIGKDTGPRLSTFLWAADRNKVLDLLSI